VLFMGLRPESSLYAILAEHDKAIKANLAREGSPHTIDANDAYVALRNGGRNMIQQLARTACRPLRICAWNTGDPSVTPGTIELAQGEGVRVRLQNGRISSYVHRGEQTWAHGSLLVGRGVKMPVSLVTAIAGRQLDEIASGTLLAGLGLTVRKAWNVGGSLGMSFKPRIIDVHEALAMTSTHRIAA